MRKRKSLQKKKIFIGTAAIGLIGIGYFVGKEVAFTIAAKRTATDINKALPKMSVESAKEFVDMFRNVIK